MRRTVYLPDDLAAQVDEYLQTRRNLTFSALVRQILEREVAPKDLSPLLEMVGLVSKFGPPQPVPLEERQPEDRYTDKI